MLDMLVAAPSEEHKALIALCGLVGLRVSEARTLTPSCIEVDVMEVTVFGKGDKQRTIPLTKAAWHFIQPAWIQSVIRDETGDSPMIRLSDRGARKFLKEMGFKAGLVREISSHDLRATFATAAYKRTKDIRAVQTLLGHANSSTTEVYTGVEMDAMRAASEIF